MCLAYEVSVSAWLCVCAPEPGRSRCFSWGWPALGCRICAIDGCVLLTVWLLFARVLVAEAADAGTPLEGLPTPVSSSGMAAWSFRHAM